MHAADDTGDGQRSRSMESGKDGKGVLKGTLKHRPITTRASTKESTGQRPMISRYSRSLPLKMER